jgi:phage tail protein X
MSEEYNELQVVEKDGGPAKVSDETLSNLKDVVRDIRSECSTYVMERRENAENTRYCHWEGQSTDGRKRKEAMGKDPLPFDGASDNRVRLVDKLVRIFEKQVVASATRSEALISGTEINDAAFAGKLQVLLRYVIKNVWGDSYRRNNKLAANYLYGDSPAACVAYVDWLFEEGMEYRTIRADEALAALVENAMQQAGPEDPAVMEQIIVQANMLFADPGQVDLLADALEIILPDVAPARRKKVAKDLQKDMEAQYPARYVRKNEPCYKALRLYEDVFMPTNVQDIQRSPCVILREWYTKAEIIERAAVEGWGESFVQKLLYGEEGRTDGSGHEGQSAFDDYTVSGPERSHYATVDNRKGLYEILRCYTRAANEDGVLGIYYYTISDFVDEAAKDRDLWDRKHGKYPFVIQTAECLTSRLMDSRGASELAQTDQAGMKLLRDSFEDHVQVAINPPLIKPRGRPFFNVNRAPFGQIDADSRDQIKFLEPNQYPQAADRMNQEMRREVNEYFGIFDPVTNPNELMVTLFTQDRVDDFLSFLSQVHAMTIQLCQQYMEDETVQRIVGGQGVPIARSIEEIQGRFDYQLSFDVNNLDLDKIIKKADVVLKNIRPLDTKGIIPYGPFLRQITAAIDSNWAELIPPEDVAEQRIVTEEQNNVVLMLNGIEPGMPETIEAPGMRLQVIEQTLAPRMQNPGAYPPLSPAAQMIIQNRMKYLSFQDSQMANAEIGRVGAEPITEQEIAEAGQV